MIGTIISNYRISGIDAMRPVIERQRAQILLCYERALVAKPALEGTVRVMFSIEPYGTVSEATAEGLDDAVDKCLVDIFEKLMFSPLGGERHVQATHFLTFRPAP